MSSYKQINILDRKDIEYGIAKGNPLKKIAKDLGKGTSTITNEILKNRTHFEAMHHFSNDCIHAQECNKGNLCGDSKCPFACKWCRKADTIGKCNTRCPDYSSIKCSFLLYPPYVCNNCQQKNYCTKDRYLYIAKEAEEASTNRRSNSRKGSQLSKEDLDKIDKLLFKLIVKKGQSIAHIMSKYAKELKVCERTLYNYIEKRYLKTMDVDLRRKVKYAPRKSDPNKDDKRKDRSFRLGRSYADFNDYVTSNTDQMVFEMDTVIGKQGEPKRVLTLLFRRNSILMIFLLPNGKASSVQAVFDWIEHHLGIDAFRRLFPVGLGDNGAEFQQVESIELNPQGEYRTNIYYCDPMASWQKGAIEKAHEFIRYVLPKGTSFQKLEQEDFTLIMNHINSFRRKSLNGLCPYELIDPNDADMKALMKILKMELIPPENVCLKPSLLKNGY